MNHVGTKLFHHSLQLGSGLRIERLQQRTETGEGAEAGIIRQVLAALPGLRPRRQNLEPLVECPCRIGNLFCLGVVQPLRDRPMPERACRYGALSLLPLLMFRLDTDVCVRYVPAAGSSIR